MDEEKANMEDFFEISLQEKCYEIFKDHFLVQEIYIKVNGRITKVLYKDILFIEALADYIVVQTAQHKYVVHSTMKGIELKLPSYQFIRVHRSYIINKANIIAIQDSSIIIPFTKNIPIGKSYKDSFFQQLNML